MPVTDLTGTTWVFNNTFPSHFPEKGEYYTDGDIRGLTPTSDYGYFIDFIWKDEQGEYNCNYIYNYNFDAGTTIGVATYPSGTEHLFNGSMTITGGTDATNTGLISWLQANATQQAVSTKLSVDLTTLSGWANLAPGNHTIKIVAKGTGYRDSEPSASVSVTKPAAAYTDCLTFTGETSDFTLAVGSAGAKEWDGTLYYSTDHNIWNVWDGTAISSANKKLYLRGKNNTKFYTSNGAYLSLSAKAGCSGNIQALIDWENPPTSISENFCYANMFRNCTNLTTAPELPAMTLKGRCYLNMFQDCTNLTTAPELPATTLAVNCYQNMFYGCTSLIAAPELLATVLKSYCYSSMFSNCKSLTEAPNLPAITLVDFCYTSMFQGCTKLKVNASSGNKIFTCPSSIPSGAVNSMFGSTGGSFTGTPTAGNTYYWTE